MSVPIRSVRLLAVSLTFLLSAPLALFSGVRPVFTTPVAQAATTDQLQKQKDALEQQIQQDKKAAEAQKSVAEQAADKIQEVNGQIDSVQSQISSTDSNLTDTQAQIDQKNQEIAGLESSLRTISDQLDAVVRQMYITYKTMPDNLVLFSDQSVSSRSQDQEHLDELQKSVQALSAKTETAKLAVEKNRDDLKKQSDSLQSLKVQQQEQQRGLADMRSQQAALQENAEQAVQDLNAKAAAAAKQESQIENQIEAALSAAVSKLGGGHASGRRVTRGQLVGHEGSTGNSTGPHVHFEVRVNNVPVSPTPYVNNGTFIWPISKFVVSQGFGYTSYAASGAYGGAMHTGIDLAGPYGEAVVAPASGTVILDQYYGGYGNAVAIQLDNGIVCLMGHMTGS